MSGKLSLYTYALAVVVLIPFVFLAYNESHKYFELDIPLIPVLSFVYNMVWGIVIAGLISISGRAVDIYMKDKKAPSIYYSAPFSLFAFGFISYAIFGALFKALSNGPQSFDVSQFVTMSFILYTASGILIALIGAVIHHHIKENAVAEEKPIKKTG